MSAAQVLELVETREAPDERDDAAVEWLVDNAVAYRAIVDAIGRAQESIWITQLAIDADCRVYDERSTGEDAPLLLDALIAASRERGVAVRIILNETLLLDTATPLRKALRLAGATDIRVRGLHHFPQLLHAKMVIVDEREAMLVGSPFVNGYWDDSSHAPSDTRRPARELGGRPLHDLSLRVTGPAVHTLGGIFAELWNDASIGDAGDAPIECRPQPQRESNTRVLRTVAHGILSRQPDGLAEIVDAIEAGIANARRFIYIEHQYLSSARVIDALASALAREPELEVVAVLNQNPDVTAYRVWQKTRLGNAGLLDHPRMGIFALWSALPTPGTAHDWAINQVFVHSKVLMVDDSWLTAGSANLDGVSLHSYGDDFTSRLGERVFRGVRNYDVNIELSADDDASLATLRALRTTLWREHLAMPALEPDAEPVEGWLALWRARAAENIARLNAPASIAAKPVAMLLPYSVQATPKRQLADLGVHVADRIDLRFDPSWLEVHCSPNWIRNMFA